MRGDAILEATQRFATAAKAAQAVADRVAEIIDFAVNARGRASLLVPGGKTPVAVFEALRVRDLPWDRVYISLTDERRVPEDDAASNAKLVREHLLQDAAAAAHFYPLHRHGVDERSDEAACGAALSMLPRPFDAVILGMGEDAHIASMFPGDPALSRALSPKTEARCTTATAPNHPQARLTLTLATLLESRWIALHIAGERKWQVLNEAVKTNDPMQHPVAALLAQRHVPVHIYFSP